MSWEGWVSALAKGVAFLNPPTPEGDVESGAYGARIGESILAKWFPRPAGTMTWEESWRLRDEAAKGNFPTETRRSDVSAIGKMPGPWSTGYVFPQQYGDQTGDDFTGYDPKSFDRRFRHHRRINPMNPRAARRAVARLRSSMKLLHRIEGMLPRARSRGHHAFHFRRRHRRR